jgi:hypothetical protein
MTCYSTTDKAVTLSGYEVQNYHFYRTDLTWTSFTKSISSCIGPFCDCTPISVQHRYQVFLKMAQGLDVTSSVLTLIGAANQIGHTLSRFASLPDISEVVLALHNEVSDLRVVLDVTYSEIIRHEHLPANNFLSDQRWKQLSEACQRVGTLLSKIENTMSTRLDQLDGRTGPLSRVSWLREQDHIVKIREDIRNVREEISTVIGVLHS